MYHAQYSIIHHNIITRPLGFSVVLRETGTIAPKQPGQASYPGNDPEMAPAPPYHGVVYIRGMRTTTVD